MVAIWPESRLALASSRTSELGREGLLSPLTEWRDCRAEDRRRFSFSDISDRGRLARNVASGMIGGVEAGGERVEAEEMSGLFWFEREGPASVIVVCVRMGGRKVRG